MDINYQSRFANEFATEALPRGTTHFRNSPR